MNKNTLLINKYKPTGFRDFVQEEHEPLIQFFQKQIASNKLLTLIVGEEETGKTTLLNTILREYYDTPFSAYHSNVLYLHYLKEQGASFYKNEVKYFCQTYCSLPGKKKTIVLDDLDFMAESYQTIFTKIIEKYANHVNFIASCKFLHKVLYGIQTRVMIVQLPRWTVASLMGIANRIVVEEGMCFEPEAMDLLIQVSKCKINRLINSIDKIKLVTHFSTSGTAGTDSDTGCTTCITQEMVHQLCANIQYTVYHQYFTHIMEKQLKEAIAVLYQLHDKGFSAIDILDNMFEYVKLISPSAPEGKHTDSAFQLPITQVQVYQIITLICKYITFFYNIHEDEIELALLSNELIYSLGI
jgi:DNA polymerase III delta prime subunit